MYGNGSRGAVSSGCIGAGVRSADGRVVRCNSLIAGSKVDFAPRSKGGTEQGIMVLDVKCAFLYGQIRRRFYIELPQQGSRSGDKFVVEVLRRAVYGTRDAPQILQEEAVKAMRDLGFELSILHSPVFYHRVRNVIVVILWTISRAQERLTICSASMNQ